MNMADDEDKTYTFDELSPEAQERACDRYRDWNVDSNAWLEMDYYETWLNEMCEKRGVSFDTGGSMAIREEYNRWWVEIENEYEVLPFEVDKWILATPITKAFGSINHYKLFIEDFESLLQRRAKSYSTKSLDAQIESQRQTMLTFLKGNLEGVEISLRMNYEGGHYATHRSSSTWDVGGIKIERTIDGVDYVYEQDDDGWWHNSFYPISDFLTVDGVEYGVDESADEKAQSACDKVIKPIYDAATLALAPMFKEWFDKKIDYIATSAEKQYDYLISDEAIGESLMANEMEFDKDGNDA
jgi:hypothetical protein